MHLEVAGLALSAGVADQETNNRVFRFSSVFLPVFFPPLVRMFCLIGVFPVRLLWPSFMFLPQLNAFTVVPLSLSVSRSSAEHVRGASAPSASCRNIAPTKPSPCRPRGSGSR